MFKWLSCYLLFPLLIWVNVIPMTAYAGGSDAGGGGFDQALAFIRSQTKNQMSSTPPKESIKQVCERFMEEGREGLELLSLLLESGRLQDWDESILRRVENKSGTLILNNEMNINSELFSKIIGSSESICEHEFSLNFELKDSYGQPLAARNYPNGQIELNLDMLSTLSLESTCKLKFAGIESKLCPFLLVKMLGAHELISRYDRRIESDGIYTLSSRIVSRLGRLSVSPSFGDWQFEGATGGSPLNSGFISLYQALYGRYWQKRVCYYPDSNYGDIYKEELKSQKRSSARKSIENHLQAMRDLLEVSERVSSLMDRAFDRPLDMSKNLRNEILNEIICLSTLLGRY